jgi:preprotein translocase subunit SecE
MKSGLFEYLRQVRAEVKRVTWPSRQETTISTIAVFLMVTISSIFLYFADQIMAMLVRMVMGFGL